MKPTFFAALLAVVAACKANPERTPPAVTSGTMFRHEVLGLAVHDAIARGDLDGARRNARDLAARATLDASPEAAEGMAAMKSAASAIAAAPDLRSAGTTTGELVRTCAECHARLTGPVRLDVGWPPRREPDRRTQMLRHAWAMNELWNGMIGNSEDPWRAGAAVLADAGLAATELVPKKTSTTEVDALATSVASLGRRAALTSDTALRAEIYGQLLATCADCHTRTR